MILLSKTSYNYIRTKYYYTPRLQLYFIFVYGTFNSTIFRSTDLPASYITYKTFTPTSSILIVKSTVK